MKPVLRKGGPAVPAATFAAQTCVRAPAPGTARIALKAFQRVADHWGLDRNERATLLAASTRSIARWERASSSARLHRDQLERISYILGIFAGLHAIFGDTPFANEWVRRPNLDFGGRSPWIGCSCETSVIWLACERMWTSGDRRRSPESGPSPKGDDVYARRPSFLPDPPIIRRP
jgi:uncharacterized protein (DUF2384 family)